MMKCWIYLLLPIALLSQVGCQSESADSGNSKTPAGSHTHSDGSVHTDGDEHGDHDHAEHDHDDHTTEGHSHSPGPHGGTIVDWGGGTYHVELVFDHEAKKVTAYVFGTDEKTPAPIKADQIMMATADLQLSLKPEGESAAGEFTAFTATHEALGKEGDWEGSISALVDETPYSGKFDHGEHDHDHDHE